MDEDLGPQAAAEAKTCRVCPDGRRILHDCGGLAGLPIEARRQRERLRGQPPHAPGRHGLPEPDLLSVEPRAVEVQPPELLGALGLEERQRQAHGHDGASGGGAYVGRLQLVDGHVGPAPLLEQPQEKDLLSDAAALGEATGGGAAAGAAAEGRAGVGRRPFRGWGAAAAAAEVGVVPRGGRGAGSCKVVADIGVLGGRRRSAAQEAAHEARLLEALPVQVHHERG
mmetsp:Transcript_93620/g.303030  ORF Transcript_93620/g.303030 Transcript_93620/m.303030 type:complete len:226 (-) Transcript_93620:6380-7057(-)